ncbi:MAG: DNA-3-methyladenine glycosylase 2 family protein [Sulfuricella sp.]|nr:DNA-3-methyladenine glycosylase 2 family protein [Sulfuricella sp.]
MVPAYWEAAGAELTRNDPVLAAIIRRYPGMNLRSRGDAFQTLARAIVGQQISVKASETVWGRFAALFPEIVPAAVAAAVPEDLQGCGLSRRKTEYIQDLAGHFHSGALDPARWESMDDEAIIAELTEVRGIGRWTAEMFLIFNLLRPDVLPLDDIGLQKAVARHYGNSEVPSRARLREIAAAWAPWRSVATWYLWRSLDPEPVEY